MAYFDKEFKFDREENIEEFIAALDAGDAGKIFTYRPNQRISRDGQDYVLVISSGEFRKEFKFTPGVTKDDAISDAIVPKSTVTVDGDTFTQVLDFGEKGSITLRREFQEDSLIVTLSSSKWDGTATRYYVPA